MIGQMKEKCRVLCDTTMAQFFLLDIITTIKLLLLKLCKARDNQMACNSDLLLFVCFVYYTINAFYYGTFRFYYPSRVENK